MKVLIAVTHLLGTGHLARALTLARAFVAAGHPVTVASGGAAVPHFETRGIDIVQLPAVRSDGTDFSTLLTEAGEVAGSDVFAARAQILRQLVEDMAPDVVVTELFPFGRRSVRAEFEALLRAARAHPQRPLVLASVRDILAPPGKPRKVAFADEMIAAFYDGVLVHSDPALVPLTLSWPVSEALAPRLHYTGFVAPAAPARAPGPDAAHGDILVSAGGGTVGDRVFAAALAAARLRRTHTWRLLVSGPEDRRAALALDAPETVTIEAPRPDFRTLLGGAAASVSMCGYNTALDVLQTGVRAVMVPFDDGGEVEQTLRARALAPLDAITVLRQEALDGPTLAAAIDGVVQGPARDPRTTGMAGAAHSVALTARLYQETRA